MQEINKETSLNISPSKMIVKTGLLIVSNPNHIGKTLQFMKERVKKTLYIQLTSALSDSLSSFHPNIFNTWPKFNNTIRGIYAQASNHCENLDVRVLLSGLKYKNANYIATKQPIELIIFDAQHSSSDIENFIRDKIKSTADGYNVITTNDSIDEKVICDMDVDDSVYNHTVIGGTFDHFHIGHKLLLTEALLRTKEKITVGVTEENMLESKILNDIIEPINLRIGVVKEFIQDVDFQVEDNTVPIADLYGPTKDDPTMNALIVSEETKRSVQKINDLRRNKGLNTLSHHIVQLIDEPRVSNYEEAKISSSSARMRLLGTLLKPVRPNKLIAEKPYIIGLTGGIASGKTAITQRLEELGAYMIEADKLAHKLYEPGKPCYNRIVETFGKSVVGENGEINRRVLGSLVFKDPKQLQKLNSVVWPAMMDDIQNQIKQTTSKIVVIEAAILLLAGWEKKCHEVWTTIIPQKEAIKRIQDRNKLSEEDAKARIAAQLTNKQYVDAANVVLCSIWPAEYTRKQVDRAWQLLQSRISS